MKSWPAPTVATPDKLQTLEDAEYNGECETTDGCYAEPDGVCEHGHPSWLLQWGYI